MSDWLEKVVNDRRSSGIEAKASQHTSRLVAASHLVEAVHFIHTIGGSGVIHRDIKPPNLLVQCTGPRLEIQKAVITDFGFTCVPGADHGSPGTVMYMRHELLKQAPYGQSADIWALGVTLLEIFTGTLTMMKGRSDQEIKDRILQEYSPPERLGPCWDDHKAKLDPMPYIQHQVAQCFLPQRDRPKASDLALALGLENELFCSPPV